MDASTVRHVGRTLCQGGVLGVPGSVMMRSMDLSAEYELHGVVEAIIAATQTEFDTIKSTDTIITFRYDAQIPALLFWRSPQSPSHPRVSPSIGRPLFDVLSCLAFANPAEKHHHPVVPEPEPTRLG